MNKLNKIVSIAFLFLISIIVCYFVLTNSNNPLLIITIYSAIILMIIFFVFRSHTKSMKTIFNKEREMLYSILEDVNAMIVVWSPDLSFYKMNDCFFEKTGYSEGNFDNKSMWKKIFPHEKMRLSEMTIEDCCKDREMKTVCANGSELTTVWKTSIIKNDDTGVTLMSIGIDLTEITKMQCDLIASEKRYELSMELSEIGFLLHSSANDFFSVSSQIQKMLGFNSEHVNVQDFRGKIHPHDLPLYDTYCNIRNSNTEKHNINQLELRIESSDGGYHWYNLRLKLSDYIGDTATTIGGSLIDITKDKEKDTLIEKMAYIDDVTQIFNRNRFMMMGQDTYLCSKELGISYWLVIFDVDKFHIINDTCGYQNGNRLLKQISIAILKDMGDGGFCARIGGDNFAVLLKDEGDEKLPIHTIKKIQCQINCLPIDVLSNQTITASAGYCKMPEDGNDFAEILEHAEFALRLGEKPRANIVRYDISVHDIIIARSTLEKELEIAFENNELVLYYQPKINLTNNKVIGVEALLRWIKPDGTMIPPSVFIPVAESSNLITKISEFVVNEACQQNKRWQNMGLPHMSVSVNLTSIDFYQTDVCKTIQDAINLSGLDAKWLEIELTESLALMDVDQAILQMTELIDIGVKISMDDFGTGYSSLSYIQVLPITVLKLDRSFIMYLEEDVISQQIVSAVINICKSKHIEIIAEGIETIGQANILRTSGCDHAQGYFFGRPMPSDNIVTYLKKAT